MTGKFEEIYDIPNPWNSLGTDNYDRFAGKEQATNWFYVFLVVFGVMQVSIYRVITTTPGSIPQTQEWEMVSEVSGDHGTSDSRARSDFIVRPPSVIDSDSKPRVGAPVIGKPSTTEGIIESKNNNFKSARGSSARNDVEG